MTASPTSESMRLFYALWPDEATRAALQRMQTLVQGRYTRYENLHITLAFLGAQATAQLPLLQSILADLPCEDICFTIDRLGYFTKPRIAWAGSHTVPATLLSLQSALTTMLTQYGIAFDNKKRFKPHVTLARDANPPIDAPFDICTWAAREVALVQSLQEGGLLSYRVLASRHLQEPYSVRTE